MNTTPIASRCLFALIATALCFLGSAAQAQEDAPPDPRKLSLEEIVDIILDEGWNGDPKDLQAAYDALSPEERAEVEGFFESTWAVEGGIGLLGGAKLEMGDDAKTGGLFRVHAALGAVWPVAEYSMPIYYAMPDIPGPWAFGFQTFVGVDNFDTFVGGVTARWAYEYIGTTPYAEIGPAVRAGSDGTAAGAHLELGYANIIFTDSNDNPKFVLHAYVQAEYYASDKGPLVVLAGVSIPWLIITFLGE